MGDKILRIFSWLLILIGGFLTMWAIYSLLIETISPTPDKFGLVFVVGCGPIGLILLVPGIILFKKLKKKE